MLLDQISQQCLRRLALFLFLEDARNVTRYGIGPPGSDLLVDSRQLLLWVD